MRRDGDGDERLPTAGAEKRRVTRARRSVGITVLAGLLEDEGGPLVSFAPCFVYLLFCILWMYVCFRSFVFGCLNLLLFVILTLSL